MRGSEGGEFDWDDLLPEDYEEMYSGPENDEIERQYLAFEEKDYYESEMESEKESLRWYFDDASYYSYILFDGDVGRLRQLVADLPAHGIGVSTYGRSFKRSITGQQYNWFIRVHVYKTRERRPSRDDVFAAVSGVLGGQIMIERSDVETTLTTLQKRVNTATGAIASTNDRIDKLTKEKASALAELRTARQETATEKQHRETDIAGYEGRIRELRSELDDRYEWQNYYSKSVRKIQADLERRYRELETTKQELVEAEDVAAIAEKLTEIQSEEQADKDNNIRFLRNQITDLETQAHKLATELETVRTQLQTERANSEAIHGELALRTSELNRLERKQERAQGGLPTTEAVVFEKLFETAFPGITLMERSVSLMINEVEWSGARRYLWMLSENPLELRGKGVKTVGGFFEAHFTIKEHGSLGRLYWSHGAGDGKTVVLVSQKKDQVSDIDYLRRYRKAH